MTAVAPPPNFQNISRQSWTGSNGVPNGAPPMSSDDFRMFMPRKSAQRSNSSSSLSSQASSTSTISTSSSQPNGVGPPPSGEASTWAARKKAPRGPWTAPKTEPIAGISNVRPQSIASAGSGSSAASAMTALHSPAAMVPSQHNGAVQSQANGAQRAQPQDNTAILHLIPMNGTFDRKTITVPFFPDVLRIGRQTNNKTIPTPLNGYFDSKVLSRQHAEVWADRNGKIWIRDVKSSNGTFVNGQRLSQENRDSDPHELREHDMLELGIDIVSEDQKTIVHHKVAARVEHAGIYTNMGTNVQDLNFGEMDGPQISNMAGPGGQQQLANMRGRTPSQGSINSQRMQGPGGPMANNMNGMQPPRSTQFWLQPINMDQMVKKLNAEIKAAKLQSQELQQAHSYINSILTSDPKKDPSRSSPINQIKISPIKDIKGRFSEPPAPPPQQPLPEKPDAARSLKRSDTEKPKGDASPVRQDAQMSTLKEALSSAKRELEAQGSRLRDLEAMLSEERRAREDAEERANRLERETQKDREVAEPALANGDLHEPQAASQPEQDEEAQPEDSTAAPNMADVATSRLQQRLESMLAEMNEMKQQMEKYRERAETAEADRKSLAEMIENIRQDNAKRADRRRSRSNSDLDSEAVSISVDGSEEAADAEEGEIMIIKEKDVEEDGAGAILRRAGVQNGRPVEGQEAIDPAKASHALATRNRNEVALVHGAPAMSIITVVAFGVAVMAWLNSYPKVER
ncbi:hypothetical protein BS50DRAFT_312426 [Corynespora cassiicola Philippines]|uniref:FHA domain-containing protein n=1 Tax=Corynespora cassiicola Philippines TaxID=1448308 RepID=A0A2T2NYD2_CORCC|nr:hypothetical protein BS50DRAFT_312426 [Corynespora cassiicola Philippines]